MKEIEFDDAEQLQRILENVTATDECTHPVLRDEYAELRKAWLAFGQLLEAANVAGSGPRTEVSCKPKRRTTRYLAAFTGLAGALCLAIVIGRPLIHSVQQTHPNVPKMQAVESHPQTKSPTAVLTPRVKSTGGVATQAWDDAVDTQIVSVARQIETVEQAWRHRVDDVDLVQYRIDEVSAGMTNDAL